MQESVFVATAEAAAGKVVAPNVVVERKAKLLYELFLKPDLTLAVDTTKPPKRGTSAFETDLCVFEQRQEIKVPRIVLEFKTAFTTHDVLTYSVKAGRHKEIYPWLRYGLVCESGWIPNRFFVHNEHLDFCVAAGQFQEQQALETLLKSLIEQELETSKVLERIHFADERVNYFRREIHFRSF